MQNLTKILFYNQKGEGVGIYNHKPIYLPFTILNEIVEFKVISQEKNYYKGTAVKIIEKSNNRIDNLPENYQFIGGYELMHMNLQAEKEYKIYTLKSIFKQIAKIDLEDKNINYFQGEKEYRYRNKITLFDGGLKKKNSNEIYYLNDFLLTDIIPKTDKKGKIIIRKLNTLIEGKKTDNLYTYDQMEDLVFKVSIGSFYQVNKEVALKIYQKILDFIDEDEQVVYDLYAGIATISSFLTKKAQKVIAVEINKNSYKDALYNKKINNLNNLKIVNEEVSKFLAREKELKSTVVVDPDRTGLKKEVLNQLIRLLPNKIIYLSCNVATQASDLAKLKQYYQIDYIEIFNMFPKTYHIENLIVLTLK
ncbi:class I SAM-dependent RNA methyltransferase [Mesomycoplasma lagogenitalium]|uniref:rRNA adenine N-6-methyltransferase family protein n=1 Tax=Mesomycoplasma lagogenitalium TaxID=171286 RepID=A0ABY8LWL9_9BACT|nr:rRNA adenine N-6-methyltransferase family protein [Mesomycoplasma lagogenitalium]WGI36958.1 rRNA adenine N-6-methyltransferase family protein [Mesomycoplasma lagogenitalium]